MSASITLSIEGREKAWSDSVFEYWAEYPFKIRTLGNSTYELVFENEEEATLFKLRFL